jgi:5-bromo-4-chloroindolyl phosphate hydrolysis protein
MTDNTYIVYNQKTKEIIKTFPFFCKELRACLKLSQDYTWINKTHPKSKALLNELKQIKR